MRPRTEGSSSTDPVSSEWDVALVGDAQRARTDALLERANQDWKEFAGPRQFLQHHLTCPAKMHDFSEFLKKMFQCPTQSADYPAVLRHTTDEDCNILVSIFLSLFSLACTSLM